MANPQLSNKQLETLFQPFLERIKKELEQLSDGDKKLLWALRRKLTKELGYLERGNPADRNKLKKKKMIEQEGICPICHEPLPEKYTELDRFDAFQGYTAENTQLVHHDCHIAEQKRKGYS